MQNLLFSHYVRNQLYLYIFSLIDQRSIFILGNFGTVFVDQSYWQSSVAAKPKEGVFGFLLGGICWFAIPFAFASTTGLGYIALSAQQDSPLLDAASVDAGIFVFEKIYLSTNTKVL